MKLEYSLNNDDFLEYQLYEASKSKRIKNNRFKTKITFPIIYLILGVFSLIINDRLLFPIIMFLLAALWFLLYPIRSKKRHIKHYKNHIKETYKNRINRNIELEFNKDHVYVKDSGSESKIDTSEIKSLIELKNHFFLKLNTDMSLVIPKRVINNLNNFKEKMSELKIPLIDELNWEFK